MAPRGPAAERRERGGRRGGAGRVARHPLRRDRPLVAVSVLGPSLTEPARRAALAAFDLRDAPDHTALADRREAAITATGDLVAAAGRAMAR
ncbi:hypothetical protein [Streptomyces sp. NPDC088760]|uniref:hypothetical protein n=1 Tax=Streptomyces sp. NPDC088760 TaxID=3365890 RepID=UPI0038057C0E